ncbi:hypothetical protein D0C36_20300 [Mucilaginibacter conchicola]|uniref:Uncharacterized protein n=1 Tax=Mucilaginibacter conchicola TaxID=2303333 RepID=A0A372NQQ3_9SPHI|nr:hypothetical protein [Mucilaginibacter conchicola]RFZ91276.1 hypothetical protein D0C36_20300 [Mucilaginibacter conchicola]
MSAPFTLLINFDGQEREFSARYERWGYTHRIAVLIGEITFVFEPDEEGGYRALSNAQAAQVPVKESLLQLIAEKLKQLSR